jgi:hypothetical protein
MHQLSELSGGVMFVRNFRENRKSLPCNIDLCLNQRIDMQLADVVTK